MILSFVDVVNTGNQHISMHISKMLSNIGKKVLFLSHNEDTLAFFGIDKRLLSNKPLEICGFDIFIGTDADAFKNYDYTILETDSSNVTGKVFLIQDCCNIVSLIRNKDLIKNITGKVQLEDKNINLIFNNYIKSRASLAFLEKELCVTGRKIKIPLNFNNIRESVNEQVDQKINLKKYTQEYLITLVDILMIADDEFKPDKELFKKMIR